MPVITLLIILPLIGAILCLLVPNRASLLKSITLSVSVLQVLLTIWLISYYDVRISTLQFVEHTHWFSLPLGKWGLLQANYFVGLDGLSLPLVALSVIVMLVATFSSGEIQQKHKGYYSLLLLLNAAVIGTFAAQDFLLFYLFFEFMLLPMYFLIAIWGGKRREYASIKFFLYTLFGSLLILVVIIGLYLSYGKGANPLVYSFSFDMAAMPTLMQENALLNPANTSGIAGLTLRSWAFLFLFIGFGIKLPMVPFHTWLPDAHVEAPTPISVILAALLLKIGAYGLLRIAWPVFPQEAVQFSFWVALIGVTSIVYGAWCALAAKDLKKLIAYSSVSHMGFILLGLASGQAEGITGAIYQMVSHGLISAMLFLLAGVLYVRTHDRTINHYSGLHQPMPVYFSFVLLAFFASLGLPGLSGFIAEFFVLTGAFTGAWSDTIHILFPFIALLGMFLGAAYCLWTVQRMFIGTFHTQTPNGEELLTDLTLTEKATLIPLAIGILLLGIFPQLLLQFINPFVEQWLPQVFSLTLTTEI
jgi:NADH-quinone oxidoreductase subunit M